MHRLCASPTAFALTNQKAKTDRSDCGIHPATVKVSDHIMHHVSNDTEGVGQPDNNSWRTRTREKRKVGDNRRNEAINEYNIRTKRNASSLQSQALLSKNYE
jgi:hypothetical protein